MQHPFSELKMYYIAHLNFFKKNYLNNFIENLKFPDLKFGTF